jgi:hypothetical protein
VNPDSQIDRLNYEVMDGDFLNGPLLESFHNGVSNVDDGPLRQFVTHNPVYHLRSYVDGVPRCELGNHNPIPIVPGSWDLLGGQSPDPVLTEFSFLTPESPETTLYDIRIMMGFSEHSMRTVLHLASATISEISNYSFVAYDFERIQLIASSTPGGDSDTLLSMGDPYDESNHVIVPIDGQLSAQLVTLLDFQTTYVSLADATILGTPSTVDDCNLNNLPDDLELADGLGQDLNLNGVLDECDSDFNDDCEDRFVIFDGTTPFTNAGATTDGELDDACSDNTYGDIWYNYEATCTGLLIVETCDDFGNLNLVVYDGIDCPASAGTILGCANGDLSTPNDVACTGLDGSVSVSVTAGNLYNIRVGHWDNADTPDVVSGLLGITCLPAGQGACCESDSVTCNVTDQSSCENGGGAWAGPFTTCNSNPCPPLNDDCENRIEIFDGTTAFDAIGATTDGPDHAPHYPGGCNVTLDIWYNYEATCTGTLTVDTCLSADPLTDNTELAVYDGLGCPFSTDLPLACNDDNIIACGIFGPSSVSLDVTTGNSYKIRVGTWDSGTTAATAGVINIACEDTGSCCENQVCTRDVQAVDCNGTFYGGLNCIDDSIVCPPDNDLCEDRIEIFDGTTAFTNEGALTGPEGPASCAHLTGDTWYNYEATCTGILNVNTCLSLGEDNDDSAIAVYDGIACPAMIANELGCNAFNTDACGGFGPSSVTVNATQGDLYKIRIGKRHPAVDAPEGIVEISCYPTTNNDCEDRLTITDGTTPYSNAGATTDGKTLSICRPADDIWYNYEASCTGTLTINNCTATGDTLIAVYDGSACTPDDSTLLACLDDGCPTGFASVGEISVTEGNQYKIRLGMWSSDGGLSVGDLVLGCEPDTPAIDVIPNAAGGVSSRAIELDFTPVIEGPGIPFAIRATSQCTGAVGYASLRNIDENDGGGVLVNVAEVTDGDDDCSVDAEFNTASVWGGTGGRLIIVGSVITPESLFDLELVTACAGASGTVGASTSTTACTWQYGDTEGNGGSNSFSGDLVKVFQNLSTVTSLPGWQGPDAGYEVDIEGPNPDDVPDVDLAFSDDLVAVFQSIPTVAGATFNGTVCPGTCP